MGPPHRSPWATPATHKLSGMEGRGVGAGGILSTPTYLIREISAICPPSSPSYLDLRGTKNI